MSIQITDEMVEKAAIAWSEKWGHTWPPAHMGNSEIGRHGLEVMRSTMRTALEAVVPMIENAANDGHISRAMILEAARDPSLSDGAFRLLVLSRRGEITPEIEAWAREIIAARFPAPKDPVKQEVIKAIKQIEAGNFDEVDPSKED
jgi:hypothetical protein